MYFSVHNHTECSNLRFSDCTIKTSALIDKANKLGYKGVCITDHEAVSGHVRFLKHYQEQKKKGVLPADFKIGLGNEIYLVNPNPDKFWHFILVAKDRTGHDQLRELSSAAWSNWYRNGPAERVPTYKSDLVRVIGNKKGHLVASTACLGGQFAQLVLRRVRDKDESAADELRRFLNALIEIFGQENLFLEMQPRMQDPNASLHDQVIVNQAIPQIAEAYGLDYIVTTDSHYLTKADRYVHEAFLNGDPTNHGNRELEDFYETTYMMEERELQEHLLSHLPLDVVVKAIRNTGKIYNMIKDYDLAHPIIVPADKHIPTDPAVTGVFCDWYDKYEYIKKFAESEDVQERYLLQLIEQGFLKKKQELNDRNVSRINEELETIWLVSERLKQRMSRYYVLVRGLIQQIMWEVTYVGVGRGSVTGFYICYLIGITQINPLNWGLSPWRHLSAERPDTPDIDVDSSSSKRSLIFQRMKEYYGEENSLNTLAFKTLTAKSAVITGAKGLGLNDADAHAIADLIPFERGANWPLSDCLYGNEEAGRKPVAALRQALAKHSDKRLEEVVLGLEGIISGRSIHASAAYIFENGYLAQNSLMRAPNGTFTTAFNMDDSDIMGGLKMDVLTIEALDKIQNTMHYLVEEGLIEDQGSLKATYDKYLHPDVLEYDDPDMWKRLGDNTILDAFQFDTDVGFQAAKKIKPTSVPELAVANAMMRLVTSDGQINPIDKYVAYKKDPSLWYKEMQVAGLTNEEVAILEPHLKSVYGVTSLQEEIMLLSMDEKIAGFTIAEANKLRKAVAKKKPVLLEEVHQLFLEKGRERGASLKLLNYVWEKQILPLKGYGFSINHCIPYSIICLQEMNLVHKYGEIFWNTGCLTVNAGADEEKTDSTDYGKIAKAINSMANRGQNTALPDINKAHFGFYPDTESNEIIYGLKGVKAIGDLQAQCILSGQPYESFEGFLKHVDGTLGPVAVTCLIKAGAFDKLDERPREQLLRDYIGSLAPTLSKLTMKNLQEAIRTGRVDKNTAEKLANWEKYIANVKGQLVEKGKTPATTWFRVHDENMDESFFYNNVCPHIPEKSREKAVRTLDDGYTAVKQSALESAYKKATADLRVEILDDPQVLQAVNEKRIDAYYNEHVKGDRSAWEMETVLFYAGEHELEKIDRVRYGLSVFNRLPQTPLSIETREYGDRTFERYETTRIAGTVLDRNKQKHTVTILTPEDVVTVKLYKDVFVKYDKQITVDLPDGNKQVLDKTWFARGNKIMFTGFRRDDMFVARNYKKGDPVAKIDSLDPDTGVVKFAGGRI